jgi:hypothetical protein
MDERKRFFFEKKNQKTSMTLVPGGATRMAQTQKSFCALFSKKRRLPYV